MDMKIVLPLEGIDVEKENDEFVNKQMSETLCKGLAREVGQVYNKSLLGLNYNIQSFKRELLTLETYMKHNEYQMKQNNFYCSDNEDELLEIVDKMTRVSQQIINGIRETKDKKSFEGDLKK